MGGITEHEDALVGEVGRIYRLGIPGGARIGVGENGAGVNTSELRHFTDEVTRGACADRNGLCGGLPERAVQPRGAQRGDLGVEHHIELGFAQTSQISRRRTQRRHDVDIDAQLQQQPGDFTQVIAVAKTQRRWAEDVAPRPRTRSPLGLGRAWHRRIRSGQGSHHLVEGF